MKHLPWVSRGPYTDKCCGMENRERLYVETPKLCNGTLQEAIDEFYRCSRCNCQRDAHSAWTSNLLSTVKHNFDNVCIIEDKESLEKVK